MLEKVLHNKENSLEDAQLSTIIGLLKYLPSETFWSIIRHSCCDGNNLPKSAQELIQCDFWPRWDCTGTLNSRYVEPDVFMRFTDFDLIIEAKLYEDGGQYKEQWRNQVVAYHNEFKQTEDERKLFYITLGGNTNKTNEYIEFSYYEKMLQISINKCNWTSILLETIDALRDLKTIKIPFPNKQSSINILEDIIRGFNNFGYYNVNWFEKMETYKIKEGKFFGLEI